MMTHQCPYCMGSTACLGYCRNHGFVALPIPMGCICPPTSEQTCQRPDCGRKPMGSAGQALRYDAPL